jgi:hypothetical protein
VFIFKREARRYQWLEGIIHCRVVSHMQYVTLPAESYVHHCLNTYQSWSLQTKQKNHRKVRSGTRTHLPFRASMMFHSITSLARVNLVSFCLLWNQAHEGRAERINAAKPTFRASGFALIGHSNARYHPAAPCVPHLSSNNKLPLRPTVLLASIQQGQ